MLELAAVALCCCFSLSHAQVPVPIPVLATDPGIRYNSSSAGAPVRLEVYLETNCPDSFEAWPYLKEAGDFYGPGSLDLVIYQMQLPYHRWGQLCTEGYFVVQSMLDDPSTLVYMEYVLNRYQDFSSGATENKTHIEMLDLLATYANEAVGVDPQEFKNRIPVAWNQAWANWKLATQRGASGTPWYYLNKVDLGINYALTLAELQSLIDPLLP